jgi:hypothetical protein
LGSGKVYEINKVIRKTTSKTKELVLGSAGELIKTYQAVEKPDVFLIFTA